MAGEDVAMSERGAKSNFLYEFRTRRVRRSMAMEVPTDHIISPSIVAQVVRHVTKGDAREHFIAFYLDAKNTLIGYEVVAIGGLSNVDVHPREVFRPAIIAPASAIVIAHNHPSGDCSPSPEDKELTRRISSAGELLGIPLLDHVIVSDNDWTSFNDSELL